MALDVHLTRNINEKWGFELIGGAEEKIPLTILKMDPSSPASRAGLQSGDTLFTINGEEVIGFTYEEACRKIAECGDTLAVGVMRGLYDPVLDDQEPIFYEPGDLDPESQPTEVPFKIQRFVEPTDIGSNLIDFADTNTPLDTPYDPSILLTESRSLTASPYMNPTRSYRAFSTEPLPEVPPLEDPIILNPDYKDQFAKALDNLEVILNGNNGFGPRFKLPISEQYDPDGTKRINNTEIDKMLSKYTNMENLSKKSMIIDEHTTKTTIRNITDVKTSLVKDIESEENFTNNLCKETTKVIENRNLIIQEDTVESSIKKLDRSEIVTKDRKETMITEELKCIEKMKQEIDVAQIEKTAHSVVEDSIERAVSVAEEIQMEMEVELHSDTEQTISTSKSELQTRNFEESNEVDETDFEIIDKIASNREHLKFVEENAGGEHIKTEKKVVTQSYPRRDSKEILDTKLVSCEQERELSKEEFSTKSIKQLENTQENIKEVKKAKKTMTDDTKYDKSKAEQRIYEIGLQTIPNIKGVVHSSYHYDLLLRTFFLHLTDVMVALSRFLLSQPIFNASNAETRKTVSESLMKSQVSDIRKNQHEVVESTEKEEVDESKSTVEMKHSKRFEATEKKVKPEQTENVQRRELVTPIHMIETKMKSNESTIQTEKEQDMKDDVKHIKEMEKSEVKQVQKKEEASILVQSDEKKVISGSEMAQRTEKKLTKDVTQKMEAVISEFQKIAVEEDKQELFQRSRRSRSRSQIEEEVAKEKDPLEWLAKVDSHSTSQQISEERLSKKESTKKEETETIEKKHIETFEKQEIKHKKTKTPKQMYIATVESHVYTNKDVIFEDAAEFSETSSVQSAEEVNIAFEAIEAECSEYVALENAVRQIEEAKVVEESQELSKISAQSVATVHKNEEVVRVVEEHKKDTAIHTTDTQEVLIQEKKEIIEPVIEIKEAIKKENISVDVNESRYSAELKEMNICESKSESISSEVRKEAEIIEKIQSITDVKKSEQITIIEDTVKAASAQNDVESQIQIEDVTEKIIFKAEKEIKKEEEFAALKIVKEVETEVESSNDVIEVDEVEVNKINVSQDLHLDKPSVIIEKSTISSELEVSTESQSKKTSEIDVSSKSTHILTESCKSESIASKNVQEASFTAKSIENKLTLRTDLKIQDSIQSPPSTIDTPTPSTVPPTPLTDEYVFKLTIPLPKNQGTAPIPRDCTLSPEEEDPHIIKKKLIPHIETTIEKIVYDPPLPTPPAPGDKPLSPLFKTPGLFGGSTKPIYKIRFPPIYRKPGLFGGADNPEFNKEEIREIERKSSLLASAIDETIKSIEEYKEEVGMEIKKEVKVSKLQEEVTNTNYKKNSNKEFVIESQQNGFAESETLIKEVIEKNDKISGETKKSVTFEIGKEETCEKRESLAQKFSSEAISVQEIDVRRDQVIKSEDIVKQITGTKAATNGVGIKENESRKATEICMKAMEISENSVDPVKKILDVKSVEEENKKDPMFGYRPVVFDPESLQKRGNQHFVVQEPLTQGTRASPYITESGEIIGTIQGIVDGLEEPVLDPELAKELGKPGISEEKIAELISGEAEMLREAHVMGLSRVLNSHMHRADDSSVDFQKIKPMIDSLKDSEVLKALNEEMTRQREEERKKEEKRWTTFLQKPARAPPKAKFGYHGWTEAERALVEEPYKVKIVKQAKPKVAPDYKPEDFDTGPLPWEERAEAESCLPPVEPEEPILVPELPEYLEAVDPLKETEVPDLEDTGLPLPPSREPTPPTIIEQIPEEEPLIQQKEEVEEVKEAIEEKTNETREDMENRLAEQLVKNVQDMVDPNASIDQQLSQMRAQLAALAQLPEVIQQTLELVSRQLNQMGHMVPRGGNSMSTENQEQVSEVTENEVTENNEEVSTCVNEVDMNHQATEENGEQQVTMEEEIKETTQEQSMKVETQITEENIRNEKMQKEQQQVLKIEADSRQIKQRAAPRVGKPTRMFGPLDPDSRPVVLPGGRRWRKTSDVYNEQMIAETLQAQAELIRGKAMGFESDLLPFDERINFMKYEKPPVSLDHLQNSETYKLVHHMDQTPLKKVEMLTPVIAEADYRERCRSTTPSGALKHTQIPQQLYP